MLPGQRAQYSKQEFARDLYLLDQSGRHPHPAQPADAALVGEHRHQGRRRPWSPWPAAASSSGTGVCRSPSPRRSRRARDGRGASAPPNTSTSSSASTSPATSRAAAPRSSCWPSGTTPTGVRLEQRASPAWRRVRSTPPWTPPPPASTWSTSVFTAVARQLDWVALAAAVVRCALDRAGLPRTGRARRHRPGRHRPPSRRRRRRAVPQRPPGHRADRAAGHRAQPRVPGGDAAAVPGASRPWRRQRGRAGDGHRLAARASGCPPPICARSSLQHQGEPAQRPAAAAVADPLAAHRRAGRAWCCTWTSTGSPSPADRRWGCATGYYYSKAATLDAYELLRQLIDATDEFEGLFVAVQLPPVARPRRGARPARVHRPADAGGRRGPGPAPAQPVRGAGPDRLPAEVAA